MKPNEIAIRLLKEKEEAVAYNAMVAQVFNTALDMVEEGEAYDFEDAVEVHLSALKHDVHKLNRDTGGD